MMTPPDEQLDVRYHQLIDRLPATVAVWDRESRVTSFVLRQIETLTGAPAETWLGGVAAGAATRGAGAGAERQRRRGLSCDPA